MSPFWTCPAAQDSRAADVVEDEGAVPALVLEVERWLVPPRPECPDPLALDAPTQQPRASRGVPAAHDRLHAPWASADGSTGHVIATNHATTPTITAPAVPRIRLADRLSLPCQLSIARRF